MSVLFFWREFNSINYTIRSHSEHEEPMKVYWLIVSVRSIKFYFILLLLLRGYFCYLHIDMDAIDWSVNLWVMIKFTAVYQYRQTQSLTHMLHALIDWWLSYCVAFIQQQIAMNHAVGFLHRNKDLHAWRQLTFKYENSTFSQSVSLSLSLHCLWLAIYLMNHQPFQEYI